MASALLRRAGLTSGAACLAVALVVGTGVLAEPAAPSAAPRDTQTVRGGSADPLGREVEALQDRLRRLPEDWIGWAGLGIAYVEQARRSADPSLYAKAEGALQTSLRLHPSDNSPALTGLSTLAAARHDFAEALELADRSLAVNGFHAATHGVRGDALVELGRYDEAFAAFQRMADLRPGTASYARASYSWELRGEIPRAVEAMQQALTAASAAADTAFAAYHLAMLELDRGDVAAAARQLAAGRRRDAASPLVAAGAARIAAARGDTAKALSTYAALVASAPQPAYLTEYGELLESVGRRAEADAQYAVVRSVQQLFAASGVQVDQELALFEADHGDPAAALAAAEATYRRQRGSIFVEDALAWALHVNGRDAEALRHADQALRLGTRSATLLFHRGMIAAALGMRDRARADLTEALKINPRFSPRNVPLALATLATL